MPPTSGAALGPAPLGRPSSSPPFEPPSSTPSFGGSGGQGGPLRPNSGPEQPFGVGGPDDFPRPYGGSAASASAPPSASGQSGPAWADQESQNRPHGTVYGGADEYSPIDMTMPVSTNPVENSGSLTGHILAQGWDRGVDNNRRSNVKVAVAMAIVLFVLVGVSLLFLLTAGDAFTDMLHGVFQG
ncbi:hypothetical protein [Mangrovihabitans endophyticus]|nr:hypothetical protein [Mangrovihabitans endophyticus]